MVPSEIIQAVHVRITTLISLLDQIICGPKLPVDVVVWAGFKGYIRDGFCRVQAYKNDFTPPGIWIYASDDRFQRKQPVFSPNVKS